MIKEVSLQDNSKNTKVEYDKSKRNKHMNTNEQELDKFWRRNNQNKAFEIPQFQMKILLQKTQWLSMK